MKRTQKDIVLEHLINNEYINDMICFMKYRITDLQHAIMLLRKEGYNIKDKWMKSTGEYANRYKNYYLEVEDGI